jgi:hypothetical protein
VLLVLLPRDRPLLQVDLQDLEPPLTALEMERPVVLLTSDPDV